MNAGTRIGGRSLESRLIIILDLEKALLIVNRDNAAEEIDAVDDELKIDQANRAVAA